MSLPPAERQQKKRQRQKGRSERRFRKHYGSRAYRDALVSRGCAVADYHACAGPLEASHLTSRGAGGTWRDIVPMCRVAHADFHALGRAAFAARYTLDLDALRWLADSYARMYGHLVPTTENP